MLGGAAAAAEAQEAEVHRLGNLTITAYNSTLSNKSSPHKRERVDSAGRFIGYRNGLSLNSSLAAKESWTRPSGGSPGKSATSSSATSWTARTSSRMR